MPRNKAPLPPPGYSYVDVVTQHGIRRDHKLFGETLYAEYIVGDPVLLTPPEARVPAAPAGSPRRRPLLVAAVVLLGQVALKSLLEVTIVLMIDHW